MAGQLALELGVEPLELVDEEAGTRSAERAAVPPQIEGLGGARADFVAALGRRTARLTTLAQELEGNPASGAVRDDLRRRIHALAAGARLLRFAKLAERLTELETMLELSVTRGATTAAELAALRSTLERVPALAWSEASAGEGGTPQPGRVSVASPSSRAAPLLDPVRVPLGPGSAAREVVPSIETALVVGSDRLADALASERGAVTFEVERVADTTVAIDVARVLAPDVIVLDADRPGARQLCEALASDPLTEIVPIVVVGPWTRTEEAASYVALGVARALPKPISPEVLRRACAEASATYGRREARRPPIGEVSVTELGARLAEELLRGLSDAAVAHGRGARIDLGEGSEVLAALWGAVARVRDVVTIRSSGNVRFAATGPEGALPIAPWLGADGSEGRALTLGEARAGAVGLDRIVAIVADDDPAVTWFVAGVLRGAGAIVHEAHDGARALEIAHRFTPDLVISDVVMPLLDGFALCRALKRDPVLRDVPVILLSWKEDLLQRVRELGGGADGYLRKEASAPVIVQRVREVLRPRRRVEERLAQGGEVRGRLDGLTTRTLLGLACSVRPDSTVTVRDTQFLYEVDLRGGRPVRATRTSVDGAFERGSDVLGALLGVGAGRFAVTPSTDAVSVELSGSLDEQLLPRIAAARAAQRLLSGAELVAAERVELDEAKMTGYADATPEPARSLLRAIAAGASPRALVTSGQAAPRLVEDVLADAAAHGAVVGVIGANGEDLLAPAIEREIAILRGARTVRAPIEPPILDLGPIVYTSTPAPVEILEAAALADDRPLPRVVIAPVITVPPARTIAPPAAIAPPIAIDPPIVIAPPAPIAPPPPIAPPAARAPEAPREILSPPPPPARRPAAIASEEETPSRMVRRPSSFVAPEPERHEASKDAKEARPSRSMWLLFAVAGIVFAVGARLSRERELAQPAVLPATPAAEAKAAAPATAAAETTPAAFASGDGESKADPILPQDGPLRADDKVPPGQGMLEVVAGTSDTIWIDGTLVGNGPIVKRALAPRKEPYEIRVKLRGEERVRFVMVKEARLTRLRIAPPWSR